MEQYCLRKRGLDSDPNLFSIHMVVDGGEFRQGRWKMYRVLRHVVWETPRDVSRNSLTAKIEGITSSHDTD